MVATRRDTKRLKVFRGIGILLLAFNGIGAIYGGGSLMIHPDGSGLRLDPALLTHSPFRDFIIPGLVLFVVNGLCSLVIMLLSATHYRGYDRYTTLQGVLLLGWLAIQIVLIRTLDIMHMVMALTGIGLVGCGMAMQKLIARLEEHY